MASKIDPAGFNDYSIMSKSMNNPAAITALRKNLSSVQPRRDDDSDLENPIVKNEIEGMLNKGD